MVFQLQLLASQEADIDDLAERTHLKVCGQENYRDVAKEH